MTSPDDLTTGRFSAALTDVEQPLPAVENSRPVANRETTPRETSAAELRVCGRDVWHCDYHLCSEVSGRCTLPAGHDGTCMTEAANA